MDVCWVEGLEGAVEELLVEGAGVDFAKDKVPVREEFALPVVSQVIPVLCSFWGVYTMMFCL